MIALVVCLTIFTLPLLPNLGNYIFRCYLVLEMTKGDGHGSRVCYAIWMCLLSATCPGIYAIIAAEINQAFGPLHYQANFGLLFTQNLAYSVVIIIITKVSIMTETNALELKIIFCFGCFDC